MSDDKPRRGLGRGLSSLFGDEEAEAPSVVSPGKGGDAGEVPFNLPVDALHPGRFQPRRTFDQDALDDLAQSIREKGIVQPILVRPLPEDPRRYEIVAGERRWRAARIARRQMIPALIRHLSDQDAAEVALVENLQRRDLSPLEEAEGYLRLQEEFRHTQDELAKAIGKSRSHVVNMMRLLKLPEPLKKLLRDGSLSAGHARALLNARDPEGLAQQVVGRGLNVRQTERLVTGEGGVTSRKAPQSSTQGGGGRFSQDKPLTRDDDTRALERDLERVLGLQVTINLEGWGDGGQVVIHYDTLSQLDDILYRLNNPTNNSADRRRKGAARGAEGVPSLADPSAASFSEASASSTPGTLAALLGPEGDDAAAPSLWARAAASARDASRDASTETCDPADVDPVEG